TGSMSWTLARIVIVAAPTTYDFSRSDVTCITTPSNLRRRMAVSLFVLRTNMRVLFSRLPIPELELRPSSWIGFSGHSNQASVQLAGNLAVLALGLRYQKGCSNYRVERSPFIVKV